MGVDLSTWEAAASDRSVWRQTVQEGLFSFERSLTQEAEVKDRVEKLASRQNDQQQTSRVPNVEGTATPASDFPVTPVAVKDKKEYSPRAQLHSLLRLTDAYTTTII